jgi:tetratricopeptide (TPR) repeat protein
MEAQRLVYEAWESLGRRRAALARRALALWSGCGDAWMLLAERERDPERAVFLYSGAVEEAGRAVDSHLPGLDAEAGEFWSGHEAQPYLSARFGLADALWRADRCEEAVAHYRELLRLDSGDRQGARGRLVDSLLLLGRDAEAVQVLDAHSGGRWARPVYSWALLAFRREGDSSGARNALTLALSRNRYVPEYLLSDEYQPELPPPLIRAGDRSEALLYARDSLGVWESTPGALDWLRERVAASQTGKKKKAR